MIKKNFSLLFKEERKKFFILVIIVFISSSLEILGLFSVMPFIAIVSDQNIIENSKFLSKFYYFTDNWFNFEDTNSFIVFLGVVSICGIVLSLFFRLINIYLITKFINDKEYSTTSCLLSHYLNQPYKWLFHQNISQINKNILSEVHLVLTASLLSFLNLLSHMLLTCFVILILILANPILSTSIIIGIGLVYLLIYLTFKKKILSIGKIRIETNSKRFETINKAFSSFKIVKLLNLEDYFTDEFKKSSKEYYNTHILSDIYSISPRFLVEAIIFTGIISFILFFIIQGKNFINILPVLSLYALAAYKILPSIQLIFFSVSRIKFSEQALNSLHKELDLGSNIKNDISNNNLKSLNFNKSIKLENISFSYKNDKRILKNINLIISSNSKIGIVGKTGSGKSTLVDIIMGLLNPNSGKVLIDGKNLDISTFQEWKKYIGYVPQQIYLSDNSIKNNIAFGVNDEDIDLEKIKYVSKLSNIDEYIEKLPNKYDTLVGERGVRLSGGEIQRIAIARAMYRQPKILILDEATSSLDYLTEKKIINSIEKQIFDNVTIIHIAHRLQSLENCDKIYIMDQGEIKQEGTYKTLFENK